MPDIALVNMPFAALERPSLALGTLKAILARHGITARVHHAQFAVGEMIGALPYQLLSRISIHDYTLEWMFTPAVFPTEAVNPKPFGRFVNGLPARLATRISEDGRLGVWKKIMAVRQASPELVDRVARDILATSPKIVGCTTTFQQHVPSLALLRRIRQIDPSVITMMGGANCETRMGLATHRNFPWIDYIASGEADGLIGALCEGILIKGRDLAEDELPDGVIAPVHRANGYRFRNPSSDGVPRATFSDLDSLPIPDFSDYFEQLEESPLRPAIVPALPVETSRGCWWGAIKHCTFCGLNGSSMGYRTKSPERAFDEFDALTRRYGVDKINVVDNILDLKYLQSLIPRLARENRGWNIFYETKANLHRRQVEVLAAAGVQWLQPGIESLHTSALELMAKGTTSWRNLLLLKWTRASNIYLVWFLLWGLPGEDDAWYTEMAEWLPLIAHLQPSGGLNKIAYDRFSPYEFNAEKFDLRLEPVAALRAIYPMMSDDDLRDQAYYFDDTNERIEGHPWHALRASRRPGLAALSKAHDAWLEEFHKGASLTMEDCDERLTILDTRACAPRPAVALDGIARLVYLACDEAPVTADIVVTLSRAGHAFSGGEVEAQLRDLREKRLLITLDGHHVALALRAPLVPWRRSPYPGGEIDAAESLRIEEASRPALIDELLAEV